MRFWFPAIAAAFVLTGCGGGSTEGPAVPDMISGGFTLSLSRQGTNAQVGFIGAFQSTPKPIGAYADLFHLMDATDGDCSTLPARDLFANGPMLDAGEFLDLATPTGSLQVARTLSSGDPIYVSSSTDTSHFAPDASYTFSGPGGDDIGAFSSSFSAPGDLAVTTPDLSQPVNVDRATDLQVQWTSSGSDSPVIVIIQQNDDTGATTLEKACVFSDDGEGTIPSATLSEFNETLPGYFDGLSFYKMRTGTFSHPELEAPVMIFAQASWSKGITLE